MSTFYQVVSPKQHLYHIGSAEGVFCQLIVGNDKALLYDTGYGYGDLKKAVREITELPLIIVNSHGHLDHTCGNFRFSEDICIDEREIEFCQMFNSPAARAGNIQSARHYTNQFTREVSDILPADFDEDAYIKGGCGNLVPVLEGTVFDLGNCHLEVVTLTGHSRGGIGLLWQEGKTLLVGDAANPFVWLFGPMATSLADYIQTLNKMQALDFSHFFAGHAPTMLPKSDLDNYLDCASHIDFAHGTPFTTPFSHDREPRICPRQGYGPMDFMKPGFASVVITEDKL